MPFLSPHALELIHAGVRKLAHITEYFISGLLLFRAFRNGSGAYHEWRWALYAFAVLVFIAALDEYHQSLAAARTATMADAGIDAIGGALALAVIILKRRFGRRQQAAL